MYVSDDHKVGFVHIQKTGGTAIKHDVLASLNCDRRGVKHGPVLNLPEGYFIFTMVRNPYHRLASMYRFRRLRDNTGGFAEKFPMASALLDGLLAKAISEGHRRPLCQSDYLNDRVEIFHFESFRVDLAHICRRLAVPVPESVRRQSTNYLGEYDWRDFFDRRAVEFINDVCAEDFGAFGYRMMTWNEVNVG